MDGQICDGRIWEMGKQLFIEKLFQIVFTFENFHNKMWGWERRARLKQRIPAGPQGRLLVLKALPSQITWRLWWASCWEPWRSGGRVFCAHKSYLLPILHLPVCAAIGQGPCSLPEFQLHADSAASLSKSALLPQGFQRGKSKHVQSWHFSKLSKVIKLNVLPKEKQTNGLWGFQPLSNICEPSNVQFSILFLY